MARHQSLFCPKGTVKTQDILESSEFVKDVWILFGMAVLEMSLKYDGDKRVILYVDVTYVYIYIYTFSKTSMNFVSYSSLLISTNQC